ncbi:hypothetical protein Hypma_009783 [Hypsizygus marmoreus]|uniref:Uncharacterized protein n=1 Tax=Hypsizygus marmoreus TaxID=39966 RepID=A0A369JLB5_HYPMA|nr:hypothetical protein Hypma_009783 [Hypsizygus marmoreus]
MAAHEFHPEDDDFTVTIYRLEEETLLGSLDHPQRILRVREFPSPVRYDELRVPRRHFASEKKHTQNQGKPSRIDYDYRQSQGSSWGSDATHNYSRCAPKHTPSQPMGHKGSSGVLTRAEPVPNSTQDDWKNNHTGDTTERGRATTERWKKPVEEMCRSRPRGAQGVSEEQKTNRQQSTRVSSTYGEPIRRETNADTRTTAPASAKNGSVGIQRSIVRKRSFRDMRHQGSGQRSFITLPPIEEIESIPSLHSPTKSKAGRSIATGSQTSNPSIARPSFRSNQSPVENDNPFDSQNSPLGSLLFVNSEAMPSVGSRILPQAPPVQLRTALAPRSPIVSMGPEHPSRYSQHIVVEEMLAQSPQAEPKIHPKLIIAGERSHPENQARNSPRDSASSLSFYTNTP